MMNLLALTLRMTPHPPREEDTEDDKSVGKNKLRGSEDELEAEPIVEGHRREEPSVEYEPEEDLAVRNPQLSMSRRGPKGGGRL